MTIPELFELCIDYVTHHEELVESIQPSAGWPSWLEIPLYPEIGLDRVGYHRLQYGHKVLEVKCTRTMTYRAKYIAEVMEDNPACIALSLYSTLPSVVRTQKQPAYFATVAFNHRYGISDPSSYYTLSYGRRRIAVACR